LFEFGRLEGLFDCLKIEKKWDGVDYTDSHLGKGGLSFHWTNGGDFFLSFYWTNGEISFLYEYKDNQKSQIVILVEPVKHNYFEPKPA